MDHWIPLGSGAIGFALLWSKLPDRVHDEVRYFITRWTPLVAAYFNPYVQITFSEYGDQHFRRNKLFDSVGAYLSDACTKASRKLKAEHGRDKTHALFTLDDNMEVTDDFKGARLWWYASSNYNAPVRTRGNAISIMPAEKEPRCYKLKFHKRHRDLVTDSYLPEIINKGNEVIDQNRQRRLFTTNNNRAKEAVWSSVPFEHPATFKTLAMDPVKKKEIVDGLMAFHEGKKYYSHVGRAWKRGYLLYGPPGTGKSTMISAMANLLDYDIYDLDLTTVRNNGELRKLFLETTGKSIIVIEDIDAIEVEITSKRMKAKNSICKSDDEGQSSRPATVPAAGETDRDDNSKVTLSGLLGFVDGLWSACGGQRIIVFTTNHRDRLDEALIRRGRMDEHIELSYCRFEEFKVLAKNYLRITDHRMFSQIHLLLDENDMSPADVAHNLMLRCNKRKRDAVHADECLNGLVKILKSRKIMKPAPCQAMEYDKANGREGTTNMCQGILQD